MITVDRRARAATPTPAQACQQADHGVHWDFANFSGGKVDFTSAVFSGGNVEAFCAFL